jgi:ABC-type transport system involved in cytochrome c biogenesis permease subunit
MKQKPYTLLTLLSLLACAFPARAEHSGGLDWSAWQRMPVLQDGRIMPLDSFARAQVKKICGDVHPSLGKLGSKTNAEMKSLSPDEIQRLAIQGRPRRFLAAELLYSWTVGPEKWDDVPFLLADDETLRTNVLDVPLRGEDGSRLKFVSPAQVRRSQKFSEIMAEIEAVYKEAQHKNRRPVFSALQEKARNLEEARQLFSQLGYDPGRPGTANPWLLSDFVGMRDSWDRLVESLGQEDPGLLERPANLRSAGNNEGEKLQRELYQLAERTDRAMREFVAQWGPIETGKKVIQSIEPVGARLRQLTFELDAKMRDLAALELPDPANLVDDDREAIRSNRQNFVRWTRGLALQAAQLPWSLYSAGDEAISVVPALEATALEADRYRSEIHPWISLQALLQGSPALLHGYPTTHVEKVRAAWQDARTAYFHRDDAEGPGQFAEAIGRFTSDVRALAEIIEPDRLQLPIVERDRGLLAKTAYPQTFATDAEVFYNRIDPFYWSGCASLTAVALLGLSFLLLRKPLFWAGITVIVAGVGLIVLGFMVRMCITRWAPVTSMFETVVWVAMCVSVLTLWLTFLPLLGPASKNLWRLTAFRAQRAAESGALGAESEERGARSIRAAALAMRLVLLAGGLFVGLYYMGVLEPAEGGSGYRLGAILPRADLGSSLPTLSTSLVWAASMFVAAMFVWYLPRILPSALLAAPMSLVHAGVADGGEQMERIYRRRVVALGGAAASFFAALAALYAPFPKDIQALMPVLRSNFWLGIHVLTITTSYAGACVAWMIGNLALGFFAFGRYEMVDGQRRPPALCGTLSSLNYRILQVTVLLLAAGTILGGLWADVSWGRFWGWDPKEVGALIALLLIMAALHGRRAGWHGSLTLAVGSVLGFCGVMWAWYVVNFVLNAGLHSYGAGEGGQWIWLAALGAVQLLYIAAAIIRVILETSQPAV